MDKDNIQARISSRIQELSSAGFDNVHILDDKYLHDMLILKHVETYRRWEDTKSFAEEGLNRLRAAEDLPREWIEFVFERLTQAANIADSNKKARNNPVVAALYLSGHQDTYKKHCDIARQVCEKSFQYRHKKGKKGLIDAPILAAIDELNLGNKDTIKKIVKKHRSDAFGTMTLSDDSRVREYAWNQLKKDYPHRPL